AVFPARSARRGGECGSDEQLSISARSGIRHQTCPERPPGRRRRSGVIRGLVRFLDERTGTAPLLKKALRYVFPDHWSFLLGEIALYTFVVLVGTGIYLTLFFEPSTATTVYHGTYAPLRGLEMTRAYKSAVDLSFQVKAGRHMLQTH